MGAGTILDLVGALESFPSNSFRDFFPWPQVILSLPSIGKYSIRDVRETSANLQVSAFSLVSGSLIDAAASAFLDFLAESPQLREAEGSACIPLPVLLPGNSVQVVNLGLQSGVSHFSGTTVLHCLMSSVLKTVASYTWSGCFSRGVT